MEAGRPCMPGCYRLQLPTSAQKHTQPGCHNFFRPTLPGDPNASETLRTDAPSKEAGPPGTASRGTVTIRRKDECKSVDPWSTCVCKAGFLLWLKP